MKGHKNWFLVIILSLTLAGCAEKGYPEPSAFVFGSWYGFCLEKCIHVYKLENGKLFLDNMSIRNQSEDISFQKTPLDEKWAKKAEELYKLFPAYLNKNPNIIIGCPDCHDQGVLYLAFEGKGKPIEWKIDPVENEHPREIEAFMRALKELISELPR